MGMTMRVIVAVVRVCVFFSFLFVLFFFSGRTARAMEEKIPPKVAGAFYSADPADLSGQIEHFFLNIPGKKVKQAPVALWVPHAGLIYSGQIAAMAYYEAKGRVYDAIVLVGPSHHVPVRIASI